MSAVAQVDRRVHLLDDVVALLELALRVVVLGERDELLLVLRRALVAVFGIVNKRLQFVFWNAQLKLETFVFLHEIIPNAIDNKNRIPHTLRNV